jgi:hypothetical protein
MKKELERGPVKEVTMFVPTVGRNIKFQIILMPDESKIDEYDWENQPTLEDEDNISLWVQDLGGAKKLAQSIGYKDTIWTFDWEQ